MTTFDNNFVEAKRRGFARLIPGMSAICESSRRSLLDLDESSPAVPDGFARCPKTGFEEVGPELVMGSRLQEHECWTALGYGQLGPLHFDS